MTAGVNLSAVMDEVVKVLNDARVGGFADSLGGVTQETAQAALRRIAGRLVDAEKARIVIVELIAAAKESVASGCPCSTCERTRAAIASAEWTK